MSPHSYRQRERLFIAALPAYHSAWHVLNPPALPLPAVLQVVSDPSMDKSGVYWSWNNNTGAFENQVSEEVADDAKAVKLWEVSEKLVGLA